MIIRIIPFILLLAGCLELGDIGECSQTDSTLSCCLKQHPGQYERCGAEAPTKRPMLGERGTRIDSKTLWKGKGGARLDVENPAPGSRPGQLHLQVKGEKYLYDPESGAFRNAPRAIDELLKDPTFQNAIQKGLRYLGEP